MPGNSVMNGAPSFQIEFCPALVFFTSYCPPPRVLSSSIQSSVSIWVCTSTTVMEGLRELETPPPYPPPHAGREERAARCKTYDSADLTRSGENGTRRMRTPVASKIALAIAAATGRIDGSPAPVGGSSG